MKKKITAWFFLGMTVMAAVFAGCGSEKIKETSGTTAENAAEEEPAEEEMEVTKVGILHPDTLTEKDEADYLLLQKQLEDKGYQVRMSFAEGDAQAQAADIEELAAEGCEALLIHPVDAYALGEALAAAKEQGILIVSYEDLIMDTADISYYVTFHERMAGQSIGKAIVKEKNLEKAQKEGISYNIEFFMGSQDDIRALFFYNGILEILQPYLDNGTLVCRSKKLSFDEVGILDENEAQAEKNLRAILSEHYQGEERPDIICTGFDEAALCVQKVLKEAGYEPGTENWPSITGMGSSMEAVRAVAEGTQLCTTFANRKILAEKCAELIDLCLTGGEPEVEESVQYDNGKKIISSVLCTPGIIDADNYELLIDNGYYAEKDIRPIAASSTPVPEEVPEEEIQEETSQEEIPEKRTEQQVPEEETLKEKILKEETSEEVSKAETSKKEISEELPEEETSEKEMP